MKALKLFLFSVCLFSRPAFAIVQSPVDDPLTWEGDELSITLSTKPCTNEDVLENIQKDWQPRFQEAVVFAKSVDRPIAACWVIGAPIEDGMVGIQDELGNAGQVPMKFFHTNVEVKG